MGSKHSSSLANPAGPKSPTCPTQSNPPLNAAHFPPYICSKQADIRNKSSKHIDSDFNPMDFTLELDADRSTSTKEHLEGYPEEESPKTTLVCFPGKEGTSKAIEPDFPTSAETHLRTDASPAHCGPQGAR
jgi:hypothetical protein